MDHDRHFLRKYALDGGINDVSGWLSSGAISLVLAVNQWQRWNSIEGHTAEIGVHHGKLFILLKNLCSVGEFALAVDVFEDQQLNPDHSGHGDREKLEHNLRTHSNNRNVLILKKDSLLLTPEDFDNRQIRIFSVDGSHTAEHTESDLSFATRMLARGGVVILDDFYNQEWPGVQEGFYSFMSHCCDRFAAVAYGDNKMIISSREDQPKLLEFFKNFILRFASFSKPVVVHGNEALCISMKPAPEVFDRTNVSLRPDSLPTAEAPFHLGRGWGAMEPLGVWSIGPRAELVLDLNGSPRSLTLSISPFLPAGRISRHIDVWLGGRLVAARDLLGREDVVIELPPDMGSHAALAFDIEHPDRPADFGDVDVRPLGIYLSRIRQSKSSPD